MRAQRNTAAVLAIALLAFACGGTPPATATTPATGAQPTAEVAPQQPAPRVTFPDGFVVTVEIANDDELRAQGLMYRDQLRPGTGMLFLFAQDGEYPFWMKNTRIALDILWLDSQRKVVHVEHDVQPCRVTDCPSYPPDATARYVLEVAAGVARAHGLAVGDVLRFEGTDTIPIL
jgi:uncharacterized membrane protein (UPF0127 family)